MYYIYFNFNILQNCIFNIFYIKRWIFTKLSKFPRHLVLLIKKFKIYQDSTFLDIEPSVTRIFYAIEKHGNFDPNVRLNSYSSWFPIIIETYKSRDLLRLLIFWNIGIFQICRSIVEHWNSDSNVHHCSYLRADSSLPVDVGWSRQNSTASYWILCEQFVKSDLAVF